MRRIRQVAAAAAILAGATGSAARAAEPLTVEAIFGKPSIYDKLPAQIRWVGDSRGISYLATSGEGDDARHTFVIRSVPGGDERIVCVLDTVTVPGDIRKTDDDRFTFNTYRWDKDGKRVLGVYHDELFTLDANKSTITRRTRTKAKESDPSFSPDGRRIAYTRNHDLYTLDLDSNEETRLTATGSDSVYNGTLDWVYMEELFTRGDVKAYWWSPDGSKIAFLQIQEHPVPEFPIVDYIPTDATYRLQHYPKAGDPNPIVRVGIVDSGGGDIVWADTDTSDDSYIARVYWLGDGRGVSMEKLNRDQDHLEVLFADAASGKTDLALEESSDTWINITYLRHYFRDERRFLWGSERDGHSHLYLYNLDGSLIRQLTSGPWEVFDIDGVDEKHGKVYFTANEGDPAQRHLYVVSEKGGDIQRISREEGTHASTMSPDHRYYIDRFSAATRPTRVSVHESGGKELFAIGDQAGKRFRSYQWPAAEFFTFEDGGIIYPAMIFKPRDFDPTQKYPVIVYTYGGPGDQVVQKRWSRNHLFHGMLADQGFIVFAMDNRGAMGYGKAWEDWLLRRMGKVELEDQLAGVRWLRAQPWVDGDRIGIWGWSYGAYMTLTALFKAGDVYKAGGAVAPVSDWHLYDSIYTERYLKRPQDNEQGYEESSPINFVDDFQGKLLLMAGEADDNVHFQNTDQLTQKLIRAGKDFDLMVYPQKKHSIVGSAERTFLYNKLARFFEHTLGREDTEPIHP